MKKGFTLIELLAVIVILAIIALIAVPIVLNIIDETKNNATLRSAEFYLDAVEYTISDAYLNHGGLTDGEYPITPEGNLCKTALACSEENTLKVEVNGEVPNSGTITITNGNISAINLKYGEKTIIKDSNGDLVYQDGPTGPTLESLCELKDGTEKTIGAKYECDFGGGARNFYILELGSNKVDGSSLKDDEVALILDEIYDKTEHNWCIEGQEENCNADGLNTKLDEIASSWTKLKRSQIGLPSATQIIVAADGKTNMDITNQLALTNAWLYDTSRYASDYYWTSSPNENDLGDAWKVGFLGCIDETECYYGLSSGNVNSSNCIRPVITLNL